MIYAQKKPILAVLNIKISTTSHIKTFCGTTSMPSKSMQKQSPYQLVVAKI